MVLKYVAALVWAISASCVPAASWAGTPFKVYSPVVEPGEAELEYRSFASFDGDPALNDGRTHVLGVGLGVNR